MSLTLAGNCSQDSRSPEQTASQQGHWAATKQVGKFPLQSPTWRSCRGHLETLFTFLLVSMKRAKRTVINDPSNWQPISAIEFNIFYWSVNPKRNQSWIFIGRTDAEGDAPIIWPPDAKSWLIGKDPDAGKDWGQKEKGMTEDKMVWWHHWLNRHEFEQTLR